MYITVDVGYYMYIPRTITVQFHDADWKMDTPWTSLSTYTRYCTFVITHRIPALLKRFGYRFCGINPFNTVALGVINRIGQLSTEYFCTPVQSI
jgi:hypothetical protein